MKTDARYDMVKAVCLYFKCTEEELKSSTQKHPVVERRQIAMYLLVETKSLTITSIGDYFGRDHSTVIHACKQVRNLMETDPVYARQVTDILASADMEILPPETVKQRLVRVNRENKILKEFITTYYQHIIKNTGLEINRREKIPLEAIAKKLNIEL